MTCTKKEDGVLAAIKSVSLADIQRLGRTQRILDEKEALRRMQECPYSIQLLGTEKDEVELRFVLSAELGGSLQQHLRFSGGIRSALLPIYAAELLAALEHMSQKRVIHRDIKASNVLVSTAGHLKVCDFGSAKVFDAVEEHGRAFTLVGTPHAMAPEMVASGGDRAGDGYDRAVDWWSAGCLLLEMVTGEPVFAREESFPNGDDVNAARIALVGSDCIDSWQWRIAAREAIIDAPHHLSDVLNSLLVISARDRITRLSDFYSAAFFADIDWELVREGRLPPLEFDRRVGHLDIVSTGPSEDEELNAEQQALFADF